MIGAAVLSVAALAAVRSPASALVVGGVAAAQPVSFTVQFPLRNEAQLESLIGNQSNPRSPLYRHFLTPAQFRASFGPQQSDLQRVAAAMHARGFTVDRVTSQGLKLRGAAANVERTFATRLVLDRATRGARPSVRALGGVTLTPELAAAHATVVAIGSRLHAKTNSFRSAVPLVKPLNFLGPEGPYFADDLKEAYGFPSAAKLDGKGRTIGVVISSFVDPADIKQYFIDEGLPGTPNVVDEKIDGGQVLPPADPNNGGAFEATLDVEQTTAIAPGAKVIVYDTPDLSNQSTIDAYEQLVDDNTVDVVNSSFGECEAFFTAPYNIDPTTGKGVDMTAVVLQQHQIFLQGNAQGITFAVSSGDSGALGCVDTTFTKFILGVENPASDSAVTAVGGTNLMTTANPATARRPNQSNYKSENAFLDPEIPYDSYGVTDAAGNPVNATGGVWGSGGGTSRFFQKPAYQQAVNANAFRRSIPDVSGHMGGCPTISNYPLDKNGFPTCPTDRSADLLTFQGGVYGVIGTSASSPDFVGLLTLLEQAYGARAGNINYAIYAESFAQSQGALPYTSFRTGIPGNNGFPTNTLSYDKVLGLGTLEGGNFGLLHPYPLAGDPGTASNP